MPATHAFDAEERTLLGLLAETMIPAGGDAPSAADPAILAGVVEDVHPHADVAPALARIAPLCAALSLASFAAASPVDRLAVVAHLRAEHPAFVARFEAAVAARYYRDDRVLRALGLPARAPFPEGNAVAPTDWSLLDPVRARAPFYRRVRP